MYDEKKVSIIITTKNEERIIEKCLESIVNQSYNNIEIIVVDNKSTDRTVEIAREYTDSVYDCGPERSSQKNYGINIAEGVYALHLDADMILTPDLVKEACEQMLSNPNSVGLNIPLRWVGKNWIIKAKGFEREFYDNTCLDAVRFFDIQAARSIKGFDSNLFAGEDWDFDLRLREFGEIGYISSVMYHYEDETITLKDYKHKIIYYSGNLDIYKNKHRNNKTVEKQFSLLYRYFYVFLEKGKWKKCIFHPLAFIRMYFLKFYMGIVFVLARKN
jgi:glycosyltransferase involved in cell wall biosynthesis